MSNLNESINIFSDYRLEENDITLFEPCFCITLFSNEAVTKEYAPKSLLTPYQVFWDDFGSQVAQIVYDGNQRHGVKITPKNQQTPYEWLANPRERVKGRAFIELYAGTNKMERKLPCLDWEYENAFPEMNEPSRSYFRISLPLSWLVEQGEQNIEAYISRFVGDCPLSWGYAGFALCFDRGEVLTRKDLGVYLKNWIERHPGIMSPDPRIESLWASKIEGITSVGWITLLGPEYCRKMGGITELQKKMSSSPDINVMPFIQNGAMIRIGEVPLLGDTLHNDNLGVYHAMGQTLQPLHPIAERLATDYFHVTGIYDEDASKKWFNRFFEPCGEK